MSFRIIAAPYKTLGHEIGPTRFRRCHQLQNRMPFRNFSNRFFAGWVACLAMSALAGCGSEFVIVPVSGTVTLDDEPLADASVVFTPKNGGPSSFGRTDKSGKFSLATITTGEIGALVSDHKVSVTLSADEEFDTALDVAVVDDNRGIPRRYNSTTVLEIMITKETSAADFALTSEPDERDNVPDDANQ